jgi:endonuclease G
MKKIFVLAALSAAFALTACDEPQNIETTTPDGPIAVKFSSSIFSPATRLENDQWGQNDQVGIFMKTAGQTLSEESVLAQNYPYIAAVDNTLTARDYPIEYPNDGTAVDFIAYYPYNSSTTVTTVVEGNPVTTFGLSDLRFADQSVSLPGEVLYSNNATGKTASANTVPLQFNYAYAKLKVVVKLASGSDLTISELADLNPIVSIDGMYVRADLIFADGSFERRGGLESITLRSKGITSTEDGLAFEGLVLPTAQDESSSKVFTFNIDGRLYQKTVTQAFQGGYEYNLPFELNGGTTPELSYLNGDAIINARETSTLPTQDVAFEL